MVPTDRLSPYAGLGFDLTALERACAVRRPVAGLVQHSDRGSVYASHANQAALQAHGITASMSRAGDCWDSKYSVLIVATSAQLAA